MYKIYSYIYNKRSVVTFGFDRLDTRVSVILF